MFLTEKERIYIYVEAIIYVGLVLLLSYLTIFGSIVITMFPLMYILGILGKWIFKKGTLTTILGTICIIVAGFVIEGKVTFSTVMLAIYSGFMVLSGVGLGYICSELYENHKLKKFIKYYTKIKYVVFLAILIVLPVIFNMIARGNILSYITAKKNVETYVKDNYDAWSFKHIKTEYIPSYKGGKYIFGTYINDDVVYFSYYNGSVSDESMTERLERYNKILQKYISLMYKEGKIDENLEVKATYSYTRIELEPNEIIVIVQGENEDIDNVITCINNINESKNFVNISRIDVILDKKSTSITKEALKKEITKQYILNGISQEILDKDEEAEYNE